MPTADPIDLKQLLRDKGLRATSARAAVLRCLIEASAPLTHAEVCDALATLGYDRATLYRNLVDLTEVGLALRTDLGDHLWRFELAGRDDHAPELHPHFVCSGCGDVSCLPDDVIAVRTGEGVPQTLAAREVEIQVRGLCNACV
ncbi:MAG: Fur family transcriptional regulator [Sandaracinaceae bacterium]